LAKSFRGHRFDAQKKEQIMQLTTKDLHDDYDWTKAFEYADFSIFDVHKVLFADEGEHNGHSWILLAKLKDGKFGALSAGCDYTGWD